MKTISFQPAKQHLVDLAVPANQPVQLGLCFRFFRVPLGGRECRELRERLVDRPVRFC